MRLLPPTAVVLSAVLVAALPYPAGPRVTVDAAIPHSDGPPGGRYRGPSDVVPPAPGYGGTTTGGNGPTTPGPGGPSTPGPSGPGGPTGPATPGPVGPAGGAGAGPQTGGGVQLGEDYTQWYFWWGLNYDRYLRLKDAVHDLGAATHSDTFYMGAGKVMAVDSLRPTERQVRRDVLPVLQRLLVTTYDREIKTSCMVALAKFGQDHEEFELLPLFRARLRADHQEIRETAALAIGISQRVEGTDDLIDLLHDTPRGRELCDRSSVDDRTRAFAAYGLGLTARGTPRVDVKRRVFSALSKALAVEDEPSRDIRVSIISALGQLDVRGSSEQELKLLDAGLATLEGYETKKVGAGERWLQSHVPTSIAKLLAERPADDRTVRVKDRYLKRLTSSKRVRSNEILQSTVLALGLLAEPYEDDTSPDRAVSKALYEYYEKGRDHQARYYALIALGQIGGARNRSLLLEAYREGSKALEKPWAALALGVYCFPRKKTEGADELIGRTLLEGLSSVKNPSTRGALATALGLCGYQPAADPMREMLVENRHQNDLGGNLCVGLSLLGDQHSVGVIRETLDKSLRRPRLLRDAAVALGILGDKSAADRLLELMDDSSATFARVVSVSIGLGLIGDRRTLPPMLKMIEDPSLSDLTRAFLIVALGITIDKGPLPFNEPYARNINYRAAVPTLIDYSAGILDIL